MERVSVPESHGEICSQERAGSVNQKPLTGQVSEGGEPLGIGRCGGHLDRAVSVQCWGEGLTRESGRPEPGSPGNRAPRSLGVEGSTASYLSVLRFPCQVTGSAADSWNSTSLLPLTPRSSQALLQPPQPRNLLRFYFLCFWY